MKVLFSFFMLLAVCCRTSVPELLEIRVLSHGGETDGNTVTALTIFEFIEFPGVTFISRDISNVPVGTIIIMPKHEISAKLSSVTRKELRHLHEMYLIAKTWWEHKYPDSIAVKVKLKPEQLNEKELIDTTSVNTLFYW